MSDALLTLEDFSCERDNRMLFEGLSARFCAGDVWHLAGPNGVGKTSLLRQITGISRHHGGSLQWRGVDMAQARYEFARELLFIGHQPGIKAGLTALENLAGYCPDADQAALYRALADVGLYGFEEAPCYRLSAGQLRKVALARLVLTDCRFWVLDEPFTALDVASVAKLEARFAAHAASGGCVLLTTHQACRIPGLQTLDLARFVPGVAV